MIFRQLFDSTSSTYTYLVASRQGGEALLIDPVLDRVERYMQLLEELDLKLVKTFDTHVHADHITGMGALRDRTRCVTIMGEQSAVDVVALRVSDGDVLDIDGIRLSAMYTPGHTDDSYSLHLGDRVFTGDTLFIRGTGRTDFQQGDARQQYDSLFNKLLKLPDDTLVYPGHDYKGDTVSTIGEERAHNPRLQVSSADEYAAIMDNLNLPNPKMMDVAVPANVRIGLSQDELLSRGWALTADQVRSATPDSLLFVDVRDVSEGEANGVLAGTVHAPYGNIERSLEKGGALRELVEASGKQVVFYCAYGERSAMAVELARSAGIADAVHLDQGLVAWRTAGGSLE